MMHMYVGWMGGMIYVPFKGVAVISSQRKGNDERLCAVELRIPMKISAFSGIRT